MGTINSSNSVDLTPKVMFSQRSTNYITMAYDSNAEKSIIGYLNNSGQGRVLVSNVSGIGSISFESPTTVYSENGAYHAMTYDSNADKILFFYSPDSDGNKPYVAVCSVSGNEISVASTHRLNNPSSSILFADIAYDANAQKCNVAVYSNQQTNVGNANVFTTPYHTTNLTTENFIGFSDAAYTNGQTATIQIISTIDDAQSGLTTGTSLYVQNDGSLSTTVGVPSVFAGTAISDTEILIKQ